VLAARGTIRVRYNARKIFESFCDPEENKRIFDNCASVNFRDLLHEDKVKKTRLFEVSKTGQWTLLGIPINFESTVLAMEDWKKYEISFKLKKQGAMKHMSGFWRVVPVSQDESIVLFHPNPFHVQILCRSSDLRDGSILTGGPEACHKAMAERRGRRQTTCSQRIGAWR